MIHFCWPFAEYDEAPGVFVTCVDILTAEAPPIEERSDELLGLWKILKTISN